VVRSLLHLFSHGMSEWLLQRVTAIVMTLYAVLAAVVLLLSRPLDYAGWRGLFEMQIAKIATFAFFLSLLLHAWLGVQDVLSDYVKYRGLRAALKLAAAIMLILLGVWSLQILWGIAA
jgi:succinate dehydrogenase / fumarate reductase membrane anchor subunit